MRLIFLIVIAYIAYKLYKGWTRISAGVSERDAGRSGGEIDDVMVKDPVCEVYFPRRNGVHLRHDGEDLYFCSEACRDKFKAAHKE